VIKLFNIYNLTSIIDKWISVSYVLYNYNKSLTWLSEFLSWWEYYIYSDIQDIKEKIYRNENCWKFIYLLKIPWKWVEKVTFEKFLEYLNNNYFYNIKNFLIFRCENKFYKSSYKIYQVF